MSSVKPRIIGVFSFLIFVNVAMAETITPSWDSNITNPLSPIAYEQGRNYLFNITWHNISSVPIFEFNGINETANTNLVYFNASVVQDENSDNISVSVGSTFLPRELRNIAEVDIIVSCLFNFDRVYYIDLMDLPNGTVLFTNTSNVINRCESTSDPQGLQIARFIVSTPSTDVVSFLRIYEPNGASSNFRFNGGDVNPDLTFYQRPQHNWAGNDMFANSSRELPFRLYTNGVESYVNKADLKPGTYNYKWYANNGDNWVSTDLFTYEINKAQPNITLTASPNFNVEVPSETTVSCSAESQLSLSLFRDGNLVGSGNPVSDMATLSAGDYVYICSTDGNENFTSASSSEILHVTIASSPSFGFQASSTPVAVTPSSAPVVTTTMPSEITTPIPTPITTGVTTPVTQPPTGLFLINPLLVLAGLLIVLAAGTYIVIKFYYKPI